MGSATRRVRARNNFVMEEKSESRMIAEGRAPGARPLVYSSSPAGW